MAPPIYKVRILDTLYNVELITGEMERIVSEIEQSQEAIRLLQSQMIRENRSVNLLNQQLLTLYIQQTGTFPGGGRGDPRTPREDDD
jgi:hypothetical protein